MPSSLIFAGLVVLWLLILVPTVARRRQEVPRPTTAALSGRVLRRRPPTVAGPVRRRGEEVDAVPDTEPVTAADVVVPDPRGAAAGTDEDLAAEVPEARCADAAEITDRQPDEPRSWRRRRRAARTSPAPAGAGKQAAVPSAASGGPDTGSGPGGRSEGGSDAEHGPDASADCAAGPGDGTPDAEADGGAEPTAAGHGTPDAEADGGAEPTAAGDGTPDAEADAAEGADGAAAANPGIESDEPDVVESAADRGDADEDPGATDRAAATSDPVSGPARPDGPVDLRAAGADGATEPATWRARSAEAGTDVAAEAASPRSDGPADVARAGRDRYPDGRHVPELRSRYRPGRGGFDPAAAARAARAKYAFRQRMVLTLLVAAVVTAVAAGFLGTPMWWAHAAVDLVLVGYLVHLRRLVRMEEAIRARRAARMAGARRPSEIGDRDEPAGGKDQAGARAIDHVDDPAHPGHRDDPRVRDLGIGVAVHAGDAVDRPQRVGASQAERNGDGAQHGTTDPDGPADRAGPAAQVAGGVAAEDVPALPRLRPAPPLPLPSGTAPLQDDDLDPELPSLDRSAPWRYRRAVGQ